MDEPLAIDALRTMNSMASLLPRRKIGLHLVLTLSTLPFPSRAIEEPDYEVTRNLGDVEIRHYPPVVVAEVLQDGTTARSGNRAFRVLAGYIFGKNKGQKKFSMTAPVMQSASGVGGATNRPATQTATPGGYVMQFVLPKGVPLSEAPEPLDVRVSLRELPASDVAVVRYSGFWSTANYNEHLAMLQNALRTAGLTWSGEPVYSRYNSPFIPWFLRRNEIWLHVP